MIKTSATPEGTEKYFKSFSAYLQSGKTQHLSAVFPDARDLSAAAVYRNGFLRGCTEALRASYPVIEALVGEDYFNFLADSYIAAHPPQSSTFIEYGKCLPEFLEQQLAQHQLAYLPDFARLDKAWLRAYFAQDSNLLSEQDIEQWQNKGNAIESLATCLPESAALLTLQHTVSAAWLSLKSAETLPENTRIEPLSEHLLIWRDSVDQVRIRVLQAAELAFLRELSGGNTLARAAQSALELDKAFPIIDYFSELLDTDVLGACRI